MRNGFAVFVEAAIFLSWATLATTASAETPSAQSSDRLIVPGKRIGALYVRMPLAELSSIFCAPVEVLNGTGSSLYIFKDTRFDAFTVKDATKQVIDMTTFSPEYKTREGVGVGSSDTDVRAKHGNFSTVRKVPENGNTIYCYNSGMRIVTNKGVVTKVHIVEFSQLPRFYPNNRCN